MRSPIAVGQFDNRSSYMKGIYQPGDDPLKQIDALKLDVEKARAANQPVASGLHVQLGLLYAKTGDTNKAFGQFATEKQLFPEAAPYMDFLMSKKQGVVR